jgi:hypothetical protein
MLEVEAIWVEAPACPLAELVVARMARILYGIEQLCISVWAAAVFGWTSPFAPDAAR